MAILIADTKLETETDAWYKRMLCGRDISRFGGRISW